MFEIGLSEEQRLIQDTARRFAAERLAPRCREHERRRGLDEGLIEEFARLGLSTRDLGAPGGPGALAHALVLEELGATDAGAALALDPAGLAAHLAIESGSEMLARAVGGAGRRVAAVVDAAERFTTGGRRVSGTTDWVPADRLDAVLILQPRRALWVSERIDLEPVRPCGLEAAGASALRLSAAPVAGRVDDPEAVARALGRIRLHVAALLVGVARAARDYATRYAMERTAFGRPIAHHQALAFLLTDLTTAVDAARLAVWRAASAADRGGAAWECACAFAEAAEQALFVGPNAVQVLGGHGFMKDHPVEKYMRDVRTLAQLAGGRDEAELAVAERVVDREIGLR
ncbi:MAG: acyl-CoA/acyl-ACP dehydrogenase [Deltaproteobacteria bacterium]|nr:acyl-CoA/acyl-ACP dehydrogenase [Deltaproteobacteria bacterium]